MTPSSSGPVGRRGPTAIPVREMGEEENEQAMRFGILGPLAIDGDAGEPITLGGAKRRLLLILLLQANQPVTADGMAELLWDGTPGSAHRVQSHVSQLRKVLGTDRIVTQGGAYRLVVEPGELDAEAFIDGVAGARARIGADPSGAVELLTGALDRWRGRALQDVEDLAWAEAAAARLEEQHLDAEELLLEARLAKGDARGVAGDAEAATIAEPLRERRWAVLMRALYRSGRQADALRAYQRLRETLTEELGIDPPPDLRALEHAILTSDAELGPVGGIDSPSAAVAGAPGLPSGLVSFLLTDVVGSTRLWDSNPAAMADALARHDQLLAAAVAGHGGYLLKARGEGDSTFSVFARASDAAAAALGAQEALAAELWPPGVPIAVRMAVHAGEAVERDSDYYGPAVNRVARLRAIAEGGQVLVSQAAAEIVADHLPKGVSLVRLGDQRLRDLSRPETVYTLTGAGQPTLAAAHQPEPVAVWSHTLPAPLARRSRDVFVGRVEELDAMRQAVKRAGHGDRQVVLVSGEGGVGKSSVVARLAAECFDDDVAVFYGRCVEDVGVPYEPFAGVVEHLVGAMPPAALARWLETFGAPVARAFPAVHRALTPLGVDVQEADVERHLLYQGTRELLALAIADRPAAIVLEDLHWVDRSSVLLLRYLLDDETLPLTFVVTYRDGEVGDGHPFGDLLAQLRRADSVVRIALVGLGDGEAIELVERFAGHDLESDEAPFIHGLRRETAGNPFYLREILLHLLEIGAVEVGSDGRWRLLQHDGFGLPDSVLDVITSRVVRLGPEIVEILRAAAVIGRSFELAVLTEVVDQPVDVTLDALDRADDAGLVSPAGRTTFQFAHSLVHQTLYQALPSTRRARLHRRVAQVLEAHPDGSSERVRELAHHWTSAIVPADTDKAVAYAAQAGQMALGELAPHDAIHWFAQALEMVSAGDEHSRARLLVGLGEAQQQAGLPEHRQTLLDAAGLAEHLGDAKLVVRAALVNNRGGPSSRMEVDAERLAVLTAALRVAPADGPAERARLLATEAAELVSQADPAERRRLADEALAVARQAADPATTLLVQHLRFDACWAPDTLPVRAGIATEMVGLADQLGDPLSRFRAALRRAAVAIEQARGEEFAAAVEEVDAVADRTGFPYMRWSAAMSRSCLALLRGRFDDAEAEATASLEIGTESGQPEAFGVYGVLLADIRRHQGRLPELLPVLEEAAADLPIPPVQLLVALGYVEDGRHADGRRLLEQLASTRFSGIAFDEIWLSGLVMASEVAILTDDAPTARLLYDLQLPFRDQVSFTRATTFGSMSRYLGLLAALLGNDAAEAHLEQAAAHHASLGSPLWQAYSDLDRGWVLWHRSERAAARPWLDRAMEAAAALGADRIVRLATTCS
jgi:DNA-binding SARP family transcriptional activator/tetratricopeptide (TPR) repeat protein